MLRALFISLIFTPTVVSAESAGKVAVEMDGDVVANQAQSGCEISNDTSSGVGFDFASFAPGDKDIASREISFNVENCGDTVIKLTTADKDPFVSDNSTPENGLFAQHTSDETSEKSPLNVDLSSSTAVFTSEGETINSNFETATIDITATIVSDTSALDSGEVAAAASQFIYVYFSTGATGS